MSGSKGEWATGKSGGRWKRVNRAHLCPACHSDSWCAISPDGAYLVCCREENGSVKTKTATDGVTYYVHVLDPDAEPYEQSESPSRSTSADRAEPEVLDQVYRMLLAELHLVDAHRAVLKERGLLSDEIKLYGYRSFPFENRWRIAKTLVERFGDTVAHTIPGLVVETSKKDGGTYWTLKGAAGILIPLRASTGEIVALKVRRDDDNDYWPKYTYVSSRSYGGPGAIPAIHSPVSDLPRDVIRVTEGEFKADVTTALSGVYTMSFPGVGSCLRAIPVMSDLGTVKRILVAFDSDYRSNKTVALAMVDFCRAIDGKNVEWAIESWSPLLEAKGIDDVWHAQLADQVKVIEGEAARSLIAELYEKHGPKLSKKELADAERARVAEQRQKSSAAMNATASEEFDRHVETDSSGRRAIPLARGDHPELATRALSDVRKNSPVDMVFDREVFHRYNSGTGLYRQVQKREFYVAISRYSGTPVGPAATALFLKSSDIKGSIEIASQFASQPEFFNTAVPGITFTNGFVTVEKGEIKLVPHSPEQRSLTSMQYAFDRGARSEAWEEFLNGVFANAEPADRAARIALLQEHLGACLVGIATDFAVALILTGKGNNGKSVYIKTIRGLFPKEAVKSLPPQMWSNRFHLAGLAGIRLNAVSELPNREVVDSDEIKAIVSGDETEVAHKRGHPFELVPIAGHVFGCNKLPSTKDQTDGFWRRFAVVVFDRKFTNKDRTIGLSKTLLNELPAIAAWALEGAARLQKNGEFTMPASSLAAKLAWQVDSDQVKQWTAQCARTELEDRAEVDKLTKATDEGKIADSDLLSTAVRIERLEKFLESVVIKRTTAYAANGEDAYDSYKAWAQKSGHATLSEQKFLTRLGEVVERDHTNTGNFYPVRLVELPFRAGEYSKAAGLPKAGPYGSGSNLPS